MSQSPPDPLAEMLLHLERAHRETIVKALAVKQHLQDARVMVAMLVHAAGGRIAIGPDVDITFDPTMRVHILEDATTGGMILELQPQ